LIWLAWRSRIIVLGVVAAAFLSHTGLANHEGLEPFTAQFLQDRCGRDVAVPLRAAFVRGFREDGRATARIWSSDKGSSERSTGEREASCMVFRLAEGGDVAFFAVDVEAGRGRSAAPGLSRCPGATRRGHAATSRGQRVGCHLAGGLVRRIPLTCFCLRALLRCRVEPALANNTDPGETKVIDLVRSELAWPVRSHIEFMIHNDQR